MTAAKAVGHKVKTERKLRDILLVVAIVAIGLLLYTNRSTLNETWELLKTLDLRIVLLIPVMQLISYAFLALYYRSFFAALGHKLPYKLSYASVAALAFVNQILPSGGLSGISYLAYGWRKVAPLGTTSMIQIARYVLSSIAYILILATAALVLLLDGDIDAKILLVLAGLTVFSVICGALLYITIAKRQYADRFIHWLASLVNRAARWFGRKPASHELIVAKSLRATLDQFHSRVWLVARERHHLARPGGWIFMSTLVEISIVYLAFLAIGVTMNPAILVLAFAAANVVGVISLVPGDVGVHELAMIFILGGFGVSGAAALSATLLYRVFNKMIILPIGFFFYSHILKPAEASRGRA